MSAPRRSVEGFLSRRAQHRWPNAIVYREAGTGPTKLEHLMNRRSEVDEFDLPQQIMLDSFTLEIPGEEPLGLGNSFNDAKQAIEALLAAWKADAPVKSLDQVIKHEVERTVPKEEEGREPKG